MPLVAVLARMEYVGMGFDKTQYCSHNYEVISKLQSLEVNAYRLVGREFSLSSPAEVANAFFVDLMIPIPAQARGGKSGRLSSSAIVLDHLARAKEPHPLVAIISEHRKLNAFLTKYVASLPHKAVYSQRLGMTRIHGTCLQTHTSTGRLAVMTPNLQNINKAINFTPVHRYSVQEEIDLGVLVDQGAGPNLQEEEPMGAQHKARNLRAPASRADSMYVMMVSTKSALGYARGTLVGIADLTVADAFGDNLNQSLADFWANRGLPYTAEEACATRQVLVQIHFSEESVVYSYPADKVWRCSAYVPMETQKLRNEEEAAKQAKDTPPGLEAQLLPSPMMKPGGGGRGAYPWSAEVRFSVREAFVVRAGCVLLSADYSMIELRLMAHFAKDEVLLNLLRSGGDVMKDVAASMYNITTEAVTIDQRAQAKKVVYGLLYGAGAQSLAREMDVSIEKVHEFVHEFQQAYPGVPKYLQEVIMGCRKHGYVETFGGRRRPLPAIGSKVKKERKAAERQAVNTVCQGSAADIIKLAMVNIDEELRRMTGEAGVVAVGEEGGDGSGGRAEDGEPARLIMQVRGELLPTHLDDPH
jgi:hypothetical protein